MTQDTSPSNKFPDIKDMSFEVAMKELESIVAKLEVGQVDLADSISLYERGETLRLHCEKQLKDAELRVEKITLSADGKPAGLENANID